MYTALEHTKTQLFTSLTVKLINVSIIDKTACVYYKITVY